MSDLRGSNTPEEMGTGSIGKIIAAIIVVLAVGAAGVYTYEMGMWKMPKQIVASNELPSPTPPGQ